LRLLLAVPFLAFVLVPGVPLACLLAFVASAGYAASLPLQERLLTHTPAHQRGQVLGLNSTGLMVMQGVGAVLGGAIAEAIGRGTTGVGWTIGLLAVLSLSVTVALTRGLRLSDPRSSAGTVTVPGDLAPGATSPAPPA
jgi:predicted MFS family arabinose efflux permease